MFFRKFQPEYRGYVDSAAGGLISGWVWDRRRPRTRLDVEIYSAGARLGSTRADIYREDLALAGLGDGRYGFSFRLPPGDFPSETISAKVAGSEFFLLVSAGDGHPFPEGPLLANSTRRGLPLLRPGLSFRTPDQSDLAIAEELQAAWRAARAAGALTGAFADRKTMWGDIVSSRHRSLLEALDSSDPRALADYLVDLQKGPESTGLAQGDRAYADFLSASPEGRRAAVAPFHDMLASLAQYVGVERAECAEQDYVGASLALAQQELAAKLEAALGHALAPPTIFDGLYGLAIRDRILHGRDIQALYAALRTIEASGRADPCICEIGGGFGKAAYYAWLRGVRRYTIVDLPSVCAMQYYYLRKTLPGVRVTFRVPGEPASSGEGIDLLFASDPRLLAPPHSDIVLNCDSFPEMGDAICRAYFEQIPRWAPLLLSINQEANREITGPSNRQTVVGALLPDFGFTRRYRFRSWIRRGYVEELWSAPVAIAEARIDGGSDPVRSA